MNVKFYENNEQRLLGITLKDARLPENNNMALHICQNAAQIISNREELAQLLHTDVTNFVCANQTHSANFVQITEQQVGNGALELSTAIPDTDGLYTYERNVVISSFTADCVPVLFYK